MPAQPTIPILLLLILATLSTTANLRPTPYPLSRPPRVQCDPRTKPPTTPSPQDCATFLSHLLNTARREPPGAYKYYARHIGTCAECVDLPAVLCFGRASRCAAVVDVDDDDGEDETALSIFGLTDLWEALEGVVQRCWLKGDVRKRCNGRGYPANFPAWAGL
ncbi:MAG: hypothetical protein LQ349_004734 [Xanthoria aureola]|nr:MAG: hypothetical protein LQ349_004734 [Xanthoria aureola]